MKTQILTLATLFLLASCTAAKQPAETRHTERDYQRHWCNQAGGVMEYRLADGTRVDCLTSTHAIEFDFAKKWAESYGQATYYARMTGKAPGVVLILESDADKRFLDRLKVAGPDLKIWTMAESSLTEEKQ